MADAGLTEAAVTAWSLGREALLLHSDAFRRLYDAPQRYQLAAAVLAVAAFSEAAGQSVVLFLHRVPPLRFFVSLFLTAVLFAGGVLLWAVALWLLMRVLFSSEVPIGSLLAAVSLGHAPFFFGFLILIPWLGLIIRAVLQIWTLLAVTVALRVLQMPFSQILTASVLSWILVEAFYRFASGPIRSVHAVIQTFIYTRPERITFRTLREVVLRGIQERNS